MEGTRMKSRWLIVIALAAAIQLQGCTATKRFVEKPWGAGTWIPAAVCGLAGAGVGFYLEEEVFPGTSTVTVNGHSIEEEDDPQYYRGPVIGGLGMALLCGLAGHAI